MYQIWAGHWHSSAHRTSFTMSTAFFSKWSAQILESFCLSSQVVCPSALLDVWALCKLHSKEAGDNELCWRQADFMWHLKSLHCISSVLHSSHSPFVQYWCTVLQPQLACMDTPPVPVEAQSKLEQSPILFLGECTVSEDTTFCSMAAWVQHWHWQHKFCYASAWT